MTRKHRIKDQNGRVKIARECFLITVVLLIHMPPLPTLMPSPPSSAPPLLTLACSVVECSLIDSNWVNRWGGAGDSCFLLCPIRLFTSAVSSLIWHHSSVCWTATCVLNTTDWKWEIVCARVCAHTQELMSCCLLDFVDEFVSVIWNFTGDCMNRCVCKSLQHQLWFKKTC